MKLIFRFAIILLVLPTCVLAQDEDEWPPLSYLRGDYKAVSVVAHVRIQQLRSQAALLVMENWGIRAEVLESFKGKFKKGDVIDYVHGAEAGFRKRALHRRENRFPAG